MNRFLQTYTQRLILMLLLVTLLLGINTSITWGVPTEEDHFVYVPIVIGSPSTATVPTTIKVSVSSSGVSGNSDASAPSVSADGRYVAFESRASNLVPNDNPFVTDVFVHDRQTNITELVSVAINGEQADGGSRHPSISADGRYVAFHSGADNLVAGDTGKSDVFVYDRQTSVMDWVSAPSQPKQSSLGSAYPSISADGRYVVFESYADNLVANDEHFGLDVFIHDRNTGVTQLIGVPASGCCLGDSEDASISADGRYIAFRSKTPYLVTGDTNNSADIFVFDRQTSLFDRVSVTSGGQQADGSSRDPSISADGRYIAFTSFARNLAPNDTNNSYDIFVHDRQTNVTKLVSVSSAGQLANDDAYLPAISPDGQYIVFNSTASNLVAQDTNNTHDVFVHNHIAGSTERVSLTASGAQGSGGSNAIENQSAIANNGQYVVFTSRSILVPNDTIIRDIFVRTR